MELDSQNRVALALGLFWLASCASGEDLLLGEVEPDPQQDAATAPDGGGDGGAQALPRPSADPYVTRRCDVAISRHLALEVSVAHTKDDWCTGQCSVQYRDLRIAPDGSAWVRGVSDVDMQVIVHYDREGRLLGSASVPTIGGVYGLFAVDDRGQAWLLTYNDGRELLYRFDEGVNELAARELLSGRYADLISYPGHGILISSGGRPRVLTALDYEGFPLWSRADANPWQGRLAADSKGTIAVASPNAIDTTGVVVDWLEEGVTELRGSSNAAATINGGEFSYFIQLAFDARSQLTLFGLSALPDPDNRVDAFIERIDPVYGTQWRWLSDGRSEAAGALDMMSGSFLLAEAPNAITAIASDGRSCQRFSFDAPGIIGDIDSGPAGEIWVVGLDDQLESHLSRLERPEL
jgi:hypothetical protein